MLVVSIVFTIIPNTGAENQIMLGEDASERGYPFIGRKMGLNKPIPVQLWRWFTNMLRGD